MPQWTAEFEVGEDDARALIGAQFPSLAHAAMVRFGHGWDNTAYLVRLSVPAAHDRGVAHGAGDRRLAAPRASAAGAHPGTAIRGCPVG